MEILVFIILLVFFAIAFFMVYKKFLFHKIKAKDPILILLGLIGIISGLYALRGIFLESENILYILALFPIIVGYGLRSKSILLSEPASMK